MSGHCTVETISAFIDDELPATEREAVETHLGECPECRHELEALRGVVGRLRDLDRVAVPPTLDFAIERRVALEGERRGRWVRFERRLETWGAQPTVGLVFALVVALAVVIFVFADAVERRGRSTIPVSFTDALGPAEEPAVLTLAGRELAWDAEAGAWLEVGVEIGAGGAGPGDTRIVTVGTGEWRSLVEADSRLEELAGVDEPVVVVVGGESVRLLPASP